MAQEVVPVPKINVYVPDALAEAVRDAGIPVSTVCQRALEDALRANTALREGARTDVPALPRGVALPGRGTPRLVHALELAFDAANSRAHGFVGTEHLLLGMLDESGNLGVRVVESMGVSISDLRDELENTMRVELEGARAGEPKLTPNAQRAVALMGDEARTLGHNYVGCEHLLLALIAEPAGIAGRVLRTMGLDLVVTRRAVVTALTGFLHARANATPRPEASDQMARALADITARLDRIEGQLAAS
jgi:ATP-dependent Clp protease ATP-binding subunit ClpC